MPPWLPSPDLHQAHPGNAFQHQRTLTDAELESIRRWIDTGTIVGTPEGPALPAARYDSLAALKQAGRPDLALAPPPAIHVPASGPDIFLTFALPISAARTVRAIAIQASDPQAAHSVLIGVDEQRTLRVQHPEVLTTGYAGMDLPPELTTRLAPGGQLLLWTPESPLLTPAQPFSAAANSDLVLTIHVKTTGRAEDLTFKVGLYNAKTGHAPAKHQLVCIRNDQVEIPAGDRQHTSEAQTTLEKPASLIAIYPRAHYAARRLETSATLPDGSERPLLIIDKWDVDWAEIYRFEKPPVLPAGSVLHMRWTYDNSANNPHNPSDPPKKISTGHGVKDELAEVWLESTSTR